MGLKEIIQRSDYTAMEVAEKLSLSRAGFYKKANGEIRFRPTEVRKLAELLNLSIQEVLDAIEEDNVTKG